MPGMNLAEMFAQNQGNGFSGNYNYQPSLRPMQQNPLAQGVQAGNPKGTATLGGIDAAMAKRGSQDNSAQRLSSAGESSGVAFKHDNDGHATGSSAFDTLDGYMKKAGLNSFQTQFFSRMVESGMPDVMIEASIKAAGDRFGAEVQAELQDGHEKLANAFLSFLGRAAKPAWNLGKSMFKRAPKVPKPPKAATGPLKGKERVFGRAHQPEQTFGDPATGFGMGIPPIPAVPAKPSVINRAANAANRWSGKGSSALNAARKPGFQAKDVAKGYIQDVAGGATTVRGLGGELGKRSLSGGLWGMLDPDNESFEDYKNNMLRGAAITTLGGRPGQQMAFRSAAGQGLGNLTDWSRKQLTGVDADTFQRAGRFGGAISPNTAAAVPGLLRAAGKIPINQSAGVLPQMAKAVGLQGMGKAKNMRELVQNAVRSPMSTGYAQSGKGNLGVLDSLNPVDQAFRLGGYATGKAYGAGKNALGAGINKVVNNPGRAAAVAGGTAATAGGVATVNEAMKLRDKANAAMGEVQEASQQAQAASQAASDAFSQENIQKTISSAIQNPKNQKQMQEVANGAIGNFMQETGSNILGAVEGVLGKDAANFLEQYWPQLLAMGVGGAGGYALGGAEGAILGGIGLPLATMFAQEMLTGGEVTENNAEQVGQGQPSVNQTAASATNLVNGEGARDELAAAQASAPPAGIALPPEQQAPAQQQAPAPPASIALPPEQQAPAPPASIALPPEQQAPAPQGQGTVLQDPPPATPPPIPADLIQEITANYDRSDVTAMLIQEYGQQEANRLLAQIYPNE